MKFKESEEVDHSLKIIAKSSIFVFLAVFLSKFFTYVYRIVIARQFGKEEYGVFNLALIIFFLFGVLASLGLQEGLLRFIPIYRGKKQEENNVYLFNFALKLMLIASLVFSVLFFLLNEFISKNIFNDPALLVYLKFLSLLLPFFVLEGLFLIILRAYEKVNQYSFTFNFLPTLAQLVILLLLIHFGVGKTSILTSYFLGLFIVFIVSLSLLLFQFSHFFKKVYISKQTKNSINSGVLPYSFFMLFFGLASLVYYWVDSLVIGYFMDTPSVGLYNAAVPLALLFGLTPSLFIQLFSPLITRNYAIDKFPLINNVSKQVAKWIFLINLPFILLAIFYPGALINLTFGGEYLGAANSLRLLSIGFFFTSLSEVSQNLLYTYGKSKVVLSNLIFTAVLNLILNLLLVPRYGLDGAAFSTMTSSIFWAVLTILFSYHHTKVFPLDKNLLKILGASFLPLIPLVILKGVIPTTKISVILQGSFFILFYFLIMALLFDEKDRMILKYFKQGLISKIKH